MNGISSLPLFYLFPKEALAANAKELADLPRHAQDIMKSGYRHEQVNGDPYFACTNSPAVRYVWSAFDSNHLFSVFSKNAPVVSLCRMTDAG